MFIVRATVASGRIAPPEVGGSSLPTAPSWDSWDARVKPDKFAEAVRDLDTRSGEWVSV